MLLCARERKLRSLEALRLSELEISLCKWQRRCHDMESQLLEGRAFGTSTTHPGPPLRGLGPMATPGSRLLEGLIGDHRCTAAAAAAAVGVAATASAATATASTPCDQHAPRRAPSAPSALATAPRAASPFLDRAATVPWPLEAWDAGSGVRQLPDGRVIGRSRRPPVKPAAPPARPRPPALATPSRHSARQSPGETAAQRLQRAQVGTRVPPGAEANAGTPPSTPRPTRGVAHTGSARSARRPFSDVAHLHHASSNAATVVWEASLRP